MGKPGTRSIFVVIHDTKIVQYKGGRRTTPLKKEGDFFECDTVVATTWQATPDGLGEPAFQLIDDRNKTMIIVKSAHVDGLEAVYTAWFDFAEGQSTP